MCKILVCGIGINDSNYQLRKFVGNNYITCIFYSKWKSMLERCYSEKFLLINPTYKGCTVCNDWLLFSNFKRWMESQNHKGLQLDKDIINAGNKIYSPENCCFITQEINSLLTDSKKIRGKYPQGVSLKKQTGKFYSNISINKKRKHLGTYSSVDLAELAYVSVKREYIISKAKKLPDRIKQGLMRHADILEDRAQLLMKTAFIAEEK